MDFTRFGMGRGCLQPGNAEQTRTPGISSPQSIDNGTPVARQMFSTPATADNDTLAQLRDLLGELGTHIGNTVVSRILASQTPTPHDSPSTRAHALPS